MKTYLITDTHFNHTKIIEYCDRPLNFEEILFKSLFSITAEDVLIHLGDICIGKDEEMHQKYIMPLKCKKWLVRGNHDKKSNSWYLHHGWDFVATHIVDRYFGKNILFSHKPHFDNGFDLNIHGHLHNSGHRDPEGIFDKKHKLLAVEYTNYKAVELEYFINN